MKAVGPGASRLLLFRIKAWFLGTDNGVGFYTQRKEEGMIAFTNQCAAYDRDAAVFQYGSDMGTVSSL